MDALYNILWLDDEAIEAIPIIEKGYPVHITKVSYVDECAKLLLDCPESFHAVILDANGLYSNEPGNNPSKVGLQNLIKASQEDGIPTYIFSGTIDRGDNTPDEVKIIWEFFSNNGLEENVNIFYKNDGPGKLFDKIIMDLNNGYVKFDAYPEIKDLVLHYSVNKDSMIQLLSWIEDPFNNEFPDLASLRRILIDEIRNRWLKKMFGVYATEDINPKQIKDTCMHQAETDAFWFCCNLLNKNIHNWPQDSQYMKNAIASAFMISLNWFSRFCLQYKQNPNPALYYKGAHVEDEPEKQIQPTASTTRAPVVEAPITGIIEKDRNGLYTLNGMLVGNKVGRMYEGREVMADGTTFCKFKTLVYHVSPTNSYENKPHTNSPFASLDKMIENKDE